MLKCIRGLVMSVVVLLASAYVSPTYATSADIMITQIQAGGIGAPTQELVIIYNNSGSDVDISNWCLKNKSNVTFACFFTFTPNTAIVLPAYHYATIGSNAMSVAFNYMNFSTAYHSLNQSSGSIVGGGDTITLVNAQGSAIDSHSWTTNLIGGMAYARHKIGNEPALYIDNDQEDDWFVEPLSFIPESATEVWTVETDVCPNIEGTQLVMPEGLVMNQTGECVVFVGPPDTPGIPTVLHIRISELLPNAVGTDAGNEFIELYNPNDVVLELSGYAIQYGAESEKILMLPPGTTIEPRGYLVLRNSELVFTLPNTASNVRLVAFDGTTVDEMHYESTKEGAAWAYIGNVWQIVDQPSPGVENGLAPVIMTLTRTEDHKTPQSCAANQYRSTETNRCRLIATTTNAQTACKDNQYRSEETNRCRNVATAVAPAECKEGQERNPETNRCRTVPKMSNAPHGVLGAQTKNDGNGYVWLAVGACLVLALAYGVWEWRFELRKLFQRLRAFLRIRK